MGIPKQVLDADKAANEQLDAEERIEKAGGHITLSGGAAPLPPNAPGAAEPPPGGEPQQPAPKTESQTLVPNPPISEKDLQRMRSMLGRLGKSQSEREQEQQELESMRAEVERLKAERAELQRKLDEAPARETAAEKGEGKFSKDQLTKFREVLNRNGADYSEDEVETFAEAFGAIADARTASIKSELANARVANFKAQLERDFPGFVEIDEGKDPTWLAFLAGSMPEPLEGITYEQYAQDAIGQLDYRRFSWVVRQFYANRDRNLPAVAKGKGAEVIGQTRPQSVRGVPDGNQTTEKVVVPRSEIDRFRLAYYAKKAGSRYGLTDEQVAERLAFYETAEAEDRVNENG